MMRTLSPAKRLPNTSEIVVALMALLLPIATMFAALWESIPVAPRLALRRCESHQRKESARHGAEPLLLRARSAVRCNPPSSSAHLDGFRAREIDRRGYRMATAECPRARFVLKSARKDGSGARPLRETLRPRPFGDGLPPSESALVSTARV